MPISVTVCARRSPAASFSVNGADMIRKPFSYPTKSICASRRVPARCQVRNTGARSMFLFAHSTYSKWAFSESISPSQSLKLLVGNMTARHAPLASFSRIRPFPIPISNFFAAPLISGSFPRMASAGSPPSFRTFATRESAARTLFLVSNLISESVEVFVNQLTTFSPTDMARLSLAIRASSSSKSMSSSFSTGLSMIV